MPKAAFAVAPALALALGVLAATEPARGADALVICASGQPYVYPDGGAGIPFHPDRGRLGPLTNAQAIAAVQRAFDAWQNLPASSLSTVNGGRLPVNIKVSNFVPILFPDAPDGLSPVVFDANGRIFEYLFGSGSGILGFAGPDFGDPASCLLLEGSAFLNGPEFDNAIVAEDIMVHEFGHYVNLGHVELNGQLVDFPEGGDDSGPSPDNSVFPPPGSLSNLIETMYPFYFGRAAGTRTPHADDIASIATLYPSGDFSATTGTISGTVLGGFEGDVPVSGINVIARNIADPFADAVSTFSGAYTDDTDPDDPNVGRFVLSGLTPGAQYAVFVDQVTALAGRFSNPILTALPGPEEFYNAADESTNGRVDDPQAYELLTVTAGMTTSGIDIQLNLPQPGEALKLSDDGFVELHLPFEFEMCGARYETVFVNANGNLTFRAPDSTFVETVQGMLDGPPRIAPLWRDINPTAGGKVFFEQYGRHFKVVYEDVPSYLSGGTNNFAVTLQRRTNKVQFEYGEVDPVDYDFEATLTYTGPGLAGVSCGHYATSGLESPSDISRFGGRPVNLLRKTAAFEAFAEEFDEAVPAYYSTFDLEGIRPLFTGTSDLNDRWAGRNNVFGTGRRISLPFNSTPVSRYTEIERAGADSDHFEFRATAGDVLIAEVTRGQIDSLLCLFDREGNMIAQDDDTNGLLSLLIVDLPSTGKYSLAVTTYPDFECDGTGGTTLWPGGEGRYILDVKLLEE